MVSVSRLIVWFGNAALMQFDVSKNIPRVRLKKARIFFLNTTQTSETQELCAAQPGVPLDRPLYKLYHNS